MSLANPQSTPTNEILNNPTATNSADQTTANNQTTATNASAQADTKTTTQKPQKPLSLPKLAINIYFEMMLRLGTVFINTYMISAYDTRLLGALSGANQIFIITTTMLSFLSVGCSVLLSQALGAGKHDIATKAIHTSFGLNAIIGIVCFSVAFFGAHGLLGLLNIPQDIIVPSSEYLRAISFVILIESITSILSATIRTHGRARELMLSALVMNAICVTLNASFLYGLFGLPRLGLAGVGISSIIGRVFCLCVFWYIYLRVLGLRLHVRMLWRIDFSVLAKIAKIGGLSAGEGFLWNAQYMVIYSIIASLGSAHLSAHTVFFQISIFIFSANGAISMANEIIIGRLVGQHRYNDAYSQGLRGLLAGFLCTAVFLSIVFSAKDFVLSALHFDGALREIILPLFYVSIALELSRTLNIIMVNALRASGDVVFPFAMGVIFMWGVSVPLAYMLSAKYALVGIWLAFVADEFLRGLCNLFRWLSKRWQNKAFV